MLRSLILLFSIFLLSCISASTNNNLLPPNTGETYLPEIELADLEGKIYNFPKDFSSNTCILVLGFAHEQKDIVAKWYEELKPINKDKNINCLYKVPVIDSSLLAIRMMARNGMRMGIDDLELRKATLTLFIDKENFASTLGIDDTTTPSVVVVNKSGDIVWKGMGNVSGQKVEELVGSVR